MPSTLKFSLRMSVCPCRKTFKESNSALNKSASSTSIHHKEQTVWSQLNLMHLLNGSPNTYVCLCVCKNSLSLKTSQEIQIYSIERHIWVWTNTQFELLELNSLKGVHKNQGEEEKMNKNQWKKEKQIHMDTCRETAKAVERERDVWLCNSRFIHPAVWEEFQFFSEWETRTKRERRTTGRESA